MSRAFESDNIIGLVFPCANGTSNYDKNKWPN